MGMGNYAYHNTKAGEDFILTHGIVAGERGMEGRRGVWLMIDRDSALRRNTAGFKIFGETTVMVDLDMLDKRKLSSHRANDPYFYAYGGRGRWLFYSDDVPPDAVDILD